MNIINKVCITHTYTQGAAVLGEGVWGGCSNMISFSAFLSFYDLNIETLLNRVLCVRVFFLTNPECAKTYTHDNFRIIGQGRSSFHLSVLESVYIKTQNPVLCKQKDFIFSLGIFK